MNAAWLLWSDTASRFICIILLIVYVYRFSCVCVFAAIITFMLQYTNRITSGNQLQSRQIPTVGNEIYQLLL